MEEWEEEIGKVETARNDILAKSCCTHDRKPAHAVKWCARHEVPRRLPAFLFLLRLTILPPPLSSSSSLHATYAPRGLDRFRDGANKAGKNERRAKKEDEGGREKERMIEKERKRRWREMVGCSTSHSPPAPSVAPLHRRRCARASQGHHMLTVCRADITGDYGAFIVLNIVPVVRSD